MTIKQALREVVLSKMTLEDKITTILDVVTEGITREMIRNIKISPKYSFTLEDAIRGKCNLLVSDLDTVAKAVREELRGE